MAFSIYQPPSTNVKANECGTCGCPTCGGLQCLCRPRFFAGQLLTDETLNKLEHYIVEKNKLHNRYLHGWGVVCGLEVVCNPCNAVTVRGGYALSPCGEDIIVCKEVTVDVCSLINQCKDKRRDWECEPYGTGQNAECQDVDEDWILTVRYDETTSRGITALKGGNAPPCCSSCTCGGSSGGGCGCGGSSAGGCGCGGGNGNGKGAHASAAVGVKSYRAASATVAAQCEPTLTCEGYVFEVCKPLPEKSAADTIRKAFGLSGNLLGLSGDSKGAMIDRFNACILRLTATMPKKPDGAGVTKAELYQWCCAMKQALLDNLFDHPVYNCQLALALNFACPDPNTNSTLDQYSNAVDDVLKDVMAVVAAEYLRYCLCSAFLSPCPEVVCDPRVPLATVTVRKDQYGNCRVVRICNLGKRRFVITFPNLGYWWSPILFPLSKFLRKILETICCTPWKLERQVPGTIAAPASGSGAIRGGSRQPATAGAAADTGNVGVRPVTTKRGFKAFAGQVFANRTRKITEETLFLGAIGAKDQNGQPYLAQTELANPFFTVMVNRIAGPLLAKLPDDSLNIAKRSGISLVAAGLDPGAPTKLRPAAAGKKASAPTGEIEELKARVSELQSSLKKQSDMINELRKLVKPKE
jgi:hypothetical protein